MLHVGVYCAIVSVSCSLVVTCWERADLLTRCMLCFLVLCHFPKCVLVHISMKGEVGAVKLVHQGSTFVDHLCYLCLVFFMHSRLFIAALWSPVRKGLTSWLLFVMFVFSSLSHVVSWIRCGT